MTRLVLLTDGTAQDGNVQRTNVAHVFDHLSGESDDQYCRYSPGVGTRIGEELGGSMLGLHVYRVVTEHYAWLSRCLRGLEIATASEFEVELFGFSRGAFISRVIADLLNRCGVPRKSADAERVVRLYEERAWEELDDLLGENADGFLKARVGFLGCWDTVVTALGFDGGDYEEVPANVVRAAHAVAINESRPKFDYTKMSPREGVCEEFFAGCHSDVGGGYDDNSVLSRLSLNWMIGKARDAGVAFSTIPAPVTDEEFRTARPHSEHYSLSNANGGLGHLRREIDLARVNGSVRSLPWSPFANDGGPLDSEQMLARSDSHLGAPRAGGTSVV